MDARYDFQAIESKWQERWARSELFRAPEPPREGRKFYLLEMFAYPSGDIHMGHFRNYSIGDAYGRWLLMNDRDVLHPFGWDAFGLPAENAAIKRNVHPREWTLGNIEVSKKTLQHVGIGYDWDREIVTCLPDYYRFTQWMFLTLWERGLVYRKAAPVNWCNECRTVLANEQVVDGKCWRDGSVVVKRELEQWYIRITEYAERLLDGLDTLDGWPHSTVASQRNWIGRSEGADIDFDVDWKGDPAPEGLETLSVFTTRPDTLWGVTFLTVAPESPFGRWAAVHGPNAAEVRAYAEAAAAQTEIERTSLTREKTGVPSGMHVLHPATGDPIPVFVGDYVVATYGTGYVMGVPAHDERDFHFAKAMGLPIVVVIEPEGERLDADTMEGAYTEAGRMVRSPGFDGRASDQAIPHVIRWLEERGKGRGRVQYRLRDWLISRQRYWGCPIPMVHCPTCGVVPVPKGDLPVLLPDRVESWRPEGRSPLADVDEYVHTTCPSCGGQAERDADTMDTFICSAWYHLRYVDPKNPDEPFSRERARAWLPVDLYIGGAEHANGHLIYFRFLTKVLKDAGWVEVEEPVVRLFHHGMVADAEGRTMSKSMGNVVSPMDLARKWGIDVARVAMFFFAPSGDEIRWNEDGVAGARKLVTRLFDLVVACAPFVTALPADAKGGADASPEAREVRRLAHEVLRRFDVAFRGDLAFNPAIAGVYELLNAFPDPARAAAAPEPDRRCYAEAVRLVVRAIAPIAPHLAEELHETLGGEASVFRTAWPAVDAEALARDTIEIAVQVNGKVRSRVEIPADLDEDGMKEAALSDERIRERVGDEPVRRVIVVPGRLVNVIV